jgi:CRISPR/Cas system CMR-associated protein Cmr1 (group 7 of RAMP superfamily)
VSDNLTNELRVITTASGIGNKCARGNGSVGIRKTSDTQVELSIGRSRSAGYYNRKTLSSAWAHLSMTEAHELAMALLYLSNNPIPCEGEGVQLLKHKANMRVQIEFTTDLCSMLNKGADIKKEVLEVVAKKLDSLDITGEKE